MHTKIQNMLSAGPVSRAGGRHQQSAGVLYGFDTTNAKHVAGGMLCMKGHCVAKLRILSRSKMKIRWPQIKRARHENDVCCDMAPELFRKKQTSTTPWKKTIYHTVV